MLAMKIIKFHNFTSFFFYCVCFVSIVKLRLISDRYLSEDPFPKMFNTFDMT